MAAKKGGHKERRRAAKVEEKRKRQVQLQTKQSWRSQHSSVLPKDTPANIANSTGAKKRPLQNKEEQRSAKRKAPEPQSGADEKQRRDKGKKANRVWADLVKDPPLEAEDEEIARLEKLLGIKGPDASKKREKLNRELAEKDGLGDDFGSFLESLDSIISKPRKEHHVVAGETDHEDDEDLMDHHPFEDLPTDSDSEEMENGEEEAEDVMSEESNDETEDTTDAATYRPVPGQDIYGRVRDPANDASTAPAKYVPPHFREAGGGAADKDAGRGETDERLRRLVNGQLNRMAEDSLEPVMRAVATLYRNHSTAAVNKLLLDGTCTVCVHEKQVMLTLIPAYAGLLAALSSVIGREVGVYAVEVLALKLEKALQESDRAPASNLALLLGHLYLFDVAHCSLVYDIINVLLSRLNEVDVELLLLLLRHCGHRLRHDDPASLAAIVVEGKTKVDDILRGEGDEGEGGTTQRARFMLEVLRDLKNNKKRKGADDELSRCRRIHKWLGAVRSSSGGAGSAGALRVPWNELITGGGGRGRWWIVGAAWAGGITQAADADTEGKNSLSTAGEETSEAASQLEQLAANQRMNTDVRRRVFTALMGASDKDDAFERLQRLALKGAQEREMARVLVDCCGQEKAYNKYYALVADRLCEHDTKFRFTFQLIFWDFFKSFGSSGENVSSKAMARRSGNLARLASELILGRHLSLSVVKMLEVDNLSAEAALFARVLFQTILATEDESEALGVFRRLGANSGSEHALAKATVAELLRTLTLPAPDSWPHDRQKLLKKRMKAATRLLNIT